jgi:hypothetical protein
VIGEVSARVPPVLKHDRDEPALLGGPWNRDARDLAGGRDEKRLERDRVRFAFCDLEPELRGNALLDGLRTNRAVERVLTRAASGLAVPLAVKLA